MNELSKLEFGRWLKTLNQRALSQYEKTLIGIIIDNFDEIAALGTTNGARARKIGRYIHQLNNTANRETIEMKDTQSDICIVKRLKSLQVSNFRGFGNTECFNFDTQYNLYHGPNGSGKSSFCEAIEYCALGAVTEANARNISLDKYITHIGQKNATPPQLMCELLDGRIESFPTNLAKYRFAFIEKNRIINFSHIGAATSKIQTERIAELFGLSEFQAFVHNFTDSFDGRYVVLENSGKADYDKDIEKLGDKIKRKEELTESLNDAKSNLKEKIESLEDPSIVDADDAIERLQNPQKGLIEIERNRISQSIKGKVALEDLSDLLEKTTTLIEAIGAIQDSNNAMMSDIASVNLREIYAAINNLSETYKGDVCPACQTPLDKVTVNPFSFAVDEVKKFEAIEATKDIIKAKSILASSSAEEIKRILQKREVLDLLISCDVEAIVNAPIESTDYQICGKEKDTLMEQASFLKTKLESDNLADEVSEYNNEILRVNEELREPIVKLEILLRGLVEASTMVKTYNQQIEKLEKDISCEQIRLDKLKKTLDDVSIEIEFNKKMVEAYERIRKKLACYASELPSKMSKDLSESARLYYNFINKDDAEFELIEDLQLPIKSSEKITVKMKDGTRHDALQFLSEGHVKILGLSILLAKAVAEGMPFIVFDDIVNSIDDDHRAGVALLLATHSDFNNMQMILTCHGELFVSALEDYIRDKNKVTRYMFLPADSLEARGVVIKYQDSTLPLKVAREKYENGELKDSAAKCRQAVECMTGVLWKKVSPVVGGISVRLRNLQTRPDLRQIVDGLRASTKSNKISGVETVHELLKNLSETSTWQLLNKGTHYEETLPEFSRSEIKELLVLTEALDKEIRSLKIISSAV